MGLGQSQSLKDDSYEKPSSTHTATLYYFAGRGLADQIRWMLAAANIEFTQKVISSREKFLRMCERQLVFGQLPLLQIDGHEIVQSQAAVRYLAKKAGLLGRNTDEELKADMIAEAVRDLIMFIAPAPFKRASANEADWQSHRALLKQKWAFYGERFEAIILNNNPELALVAKEKAAKAQGKKVAAKKVTAPVKKVEGEVEAAAPATPSGFLVGSSLTYADVLVAHVTTWYVEELGSNIVEEMPGLIDLQNTVISLPSINSFIKSNKYYALGEQAYVDQVNTVLARVV